MSSITAATFDNVTLLAPLCPAWCACPEDHPGQHLDGDRIHLSATAEVDLPREPAVLDMPDCGGLTEHPRLRRAGVTLRQHYAAPAPHLVVDHGETALETFELTLDEAEQFARGLLELVRAARVG